MGSIRATPSGEAGSFFCEMNMRTALPSGDTNTFMTRLKSAFLNTSGGK
ncbi:Uncharacterised protein [Mycobacterium tuberculosis]|nr:Uncharacterised protein [Mycobacterium tuberculosis]